MDFYPRKSIAPMLWISWQARTQSPQRTHLFDHEQVRDQNKKFFGDCIPSWNSSVASISRKSTRCVVGPRVSPAYFKLTAWIAANVYAYVHGHTRTRGHNRQSTWEISSKTLSTSSLTINTIDDLKDELIKFSNLSFSSNKTKNPMWA